MSPTHPLKAAKRLTRGLVILVSRWWMRDARLIPVPVKHLRCARLHSATHWLTLEILPHNTSSHWPAHSLYTVLTVEVHAFATQHLGAVLPGLVKKAQLLGISLQGDSETLQQTFVDFIWIVWLHVRLGLVTLAASTWHCLARHYNLTNQNICYCFSGSHIKIW